MINLTTSNGVNLQTRQQLPQRIVIHRIRYIMGFVNIFLFVFVDHSHLLKFGYSSAKSLFVISPIKETIRCHIPKTYLPKLEES
jgi:hypothetical protein